jgi:hypothetical protein
MLTMKKGLLGIPGDCRQVWTVAPAATSRAARAFVCAVALCTLVSAASAPARAQQHGVPEVVEGILTPTPPTSSKKKKKKGPPEQAGVVPNLSIPVAPLGFGPPAAFYLGSRVAQMSLNFLDEDTLLFTFRVPGLISREHPAGTLPNEGPTTDPNHDERHIRAVVLSLPSGKVTAEALWRLHDLSPYLRVLSDARFLLRDRNTVEMGDATLQLSPYLRFPGKITSIAVDPSERLLLSNSIEPPAPGDNANKPTIASTDPTASPFTLEDLKPGAQPQPLLRILRLDTRSVMLFSHATGNVRLPLDGEGYYEAARGSGDKWVITYADFHGATIPILPVDSACSPSLEVIAHSAVLASGCNAQGGRNLVMMTRDKRRLWQASTSPTQVWPVLTESANGQRLARATLDVSHPIGPNYPLDNTDIHGQLVQVYDSATGKQVLAVPATPILDGGGNFALSPSGKRFVVLNAGDLQVYDLDPPPPLPAIPDEKAPR